jgi:serine/threonine protein kinase
MSVICPHCSHSMTPKAVKPGRFKPKCAKCGTTFQLVVGDGPNPEMKATPLPGEAPAPKTIAPAVDATVAPHEGSAVANAEFSVAASAVKPPPAGGGDLTMALEQTAGPRDQPNLEATEVGEAPAAPAGVPAQLGGYQIIKELGRGGMGAVYLARQVSLDRLVALKVMNAQWASNPNFLVRFVREAYAAAQLVHHNVVQVYDIGAERGLNYFSMEYVEGRSLGDILKTEGKMTPEAAAGYILQAARGLKFAHDRGMIHRDIKPDNLMLNTQGVVKVADLGLVRTPGMEEKPGQDAAPVAVPAALEPSGRSLSSLSGVTLAGQAMGTPAYMAPEQSRDATSVDPRADIYSLGCTLYVMITGRPVFEGKTAMEVMTKHASDPVTRPEAVVRDIPRAMGDVVLKMVAKKPDDRYQSMGEVIKALEDFLGLQAGKATTTEQHLRVLESGVKAFNASSLASVRSLSLLGFFGGCLLLFVLMMFTRWWAYGTFFLALAGSTGVSYFLVRGATERGYLFRKVRDAILSSSWLDLLKLAGAALALVLVLFFMGLLGIWLIAVALGVGIAFGLHLGLDKRITAERAESLEKVERMLKTLRLRGLSEEALQEFVGQYAGDRWEEFFEALFGYEAKLAARARWAGKPRSKFAAWREPVVAWIDALQKRRQEAKERAHLQTIEQKNLEAQGVSAGEAKARAEQAAEAMVAKAAEIKQAVPVAEATVAPEQAEATVPVVK